MYLTGESKFISTMQGKKKDGTDWYAVKFLDDDAEEFFRAFVDENTYQQFADVKKGTIVSLTVETVLGKGFFNITNFELVK